MIILPWCALWLKQKYYHNDVDQDIMILGKLKTYLYIGIEDKVY